MIFLWLSSTTSSRNDSGSQNGYSLWGDQLRVDRPTSVCGVAMLTSLPRVSLFFAAVLMVSVGSAQPPASDEKEEKKERAPDLKPSYTAFPDLKPPKFDRDAELLAPALPELPDNATPLRKVQHEQARQGLMYLNRIREKIKV